MIRLGYLKILTHVATTWIGDIDHLAKKLADTCTRTFDVSFDDEIKQYLSTKELIAGRRRYSDLDIQRAFSTQRIDIELEDFYLSDAKIPSYLGAVPRDAHDELVLWSIWIGLIHRTKHSLTADGHLLASLFTMNEKAALISPDRNNNPFLVRNERLVFLGLLLNQDGGFLRHFIPALARDYDNVAFTRLQAVQQLQSSLEILHDELQQFGSSQAQAERQSIRKQIVQLKKESDLSRRQDNKKRPLTGIMRISPRLENLVDLGIIRKDNKYVYEYTINTQAAAMFERIPRFDKLDTFMRESYCKFAADVFGVKAAHLQNPDEVFAVSRAAYDYLGEGGYRRVRDLALTATMLGLFQRGIYLEESDVLSVLEDMRRSGSRELLMSGGRRVGDPLYVMMKPSRPHNGA